VPLFKRLGCSELFINTNTTETVSNFRQKDTIHHIIQWENNRSVGSGSRKIAYWCGIEPR